MVDLDAFSWGQFARHCRKWIDDAVTDVGIPTLRRSVGGGFDTLRDLKRRQFRVNRPDQCGGCRDKGRSETGPVERLYGAVGAYTPLVRPGDVG